MGLETAALIAFTAMRAGAAYNEGEDKAKAIAQQGTLQAKNKAKETVYTAARLKQSFLSGGIALEGTPMSVLNETFNTGFEDVNQIITNANRGAKSAISEGRSKALAAVGQSMALSSFELPSMNGLEQGIARQFAPTGTEYGPQLPIWS